MKLPKPTPQFSRAYGLARAIAFPGLYLSCEKPDDIKDYPSNLLDIQMAYLASQIIDWTPEKIDELYLRAKAEFLAENTAQIVAIRESLKEGRMVIPKKEAPAKYTELASKISISL